MSRPFGIAFLGIDHPHGAGWRKALSNLGDAVQITAIVPRFGGAIASLEERHTDAARFETVEELIARGQFDGAIVGLPNQEGPAAVCQLAAAGKHVLLEKPGAGSAADFSAAAEALQRAGVAFQSGYMWRYDPLADRLREMAADGRFGKLFSVEMQYFTSNVARRGGDHYLFDRAVSGGGFFNWLACHWLDLLLYITGEAVIGVTARVGTLSGTPVDVEDGGTAIFDLESGGMATFVGGYWLPRWTGETRWTFHGRDRWVHWEPGRPGTGGALEIHGPQPQFDAMNETFLQPEDKTPGYGGAKAVATLTDWIDAARDGRPCRNTPQSMQATLQLIDRIYQASREGRRVECRIA